MGGAVGKGGQAKQPTTIGSLQFQTAQKGGVVPIVWGGTRVAPVLIDYDDFTKHGSGSDKGKGGGKGQNTTTYSASIIMGICQGPVQEIGIVWWDKNYSGLDTSLATLYIGNDGQSPDSYWTTNHPAKALGYSGTAVLVANNFNLGSSGQLPNFSFEMVSAAGFRDSPNGLDCNPATIIVDFLSGLRYGAGFPSANLAALTDCRVYCDAIGIWLSPQLDTQKEAQAWLADIVKVTNSAIVWSSPYLKIIPYGDVTITASHTLVTLAGSVAANGGDTVSLVFTDGALPGSPITVSYTTQKSDAGFKVIAAYGLVKAVNANAALRAFGISAVSGEGSLLIRQEPAGSVALSDASSGGVSLTIDSTTTASFTPNTTPAYSLGDDDFIVETTSVGGASGVGTGAALHNGGGTVSGGPGEDPLKISRSSPADTNNLIPVEYLDRTNHYNSDVVEAYDQASIDLYGVRRESAISAHPICDQTIAQRVAQLGLQRALLYRRTFTFRLGWKYCLLEPMDLVQITDVRLGALALTVRITGIEEDDEGTLMVTAEDFIPGSSQVTSRIAQPSAGYVPNSNTAPGDVNAPLILEPPPGLTDGALAIWIGCSGGPDWGSAQIYVSLDGSSYERFGEVTTPIRQGNLTASLAASGSPDVTHTLAVDLTESRGALNSVSASDAAALVTLCYVDGELIAYQTATLTATYKYNLTTLYRGAFGTIAGSHSSSTRFARLDDAIARFTYPPNLVGRTVFFKFVSSNLMGGGTQDLSSVTAYPYTLGAAGNPSWVLDSLRRGVTEDWGIVGQNVVGIADLSSIADLADPGGPIDLGPIA